jgi:hypothetical protein
LDSDVAAFLPNKGNGLLPFVPFGPLLFRLKFNCLSMSYGWNLLCLNL